MKLKFFLFFFGLSFSIQTLAIELCSSLSEKNKIEITNDRVVTIETPFPDKAWPQVTAYVKLPGAAKQAMALFIDFNEHTKIFSDLKSAKIVSGPTQLVWVVDYSMVLPWPLSQEDYTVKNTLQVLNTTKNDLQLNWVSIKTQLVREIKGFVAFEQVNGFDCMTYSNLADPGDTIGLSLLKSMTVSKTEEAVLSFRKQMQLQLKKENSSLTEKVKMLESLLSAKKS